MPRLLIVEDDDRIRLSLRLALEDEGYVVKDVATAEEGLSEQRASPADVVLVDLMLPGMDGFDCIRALRRTADAPIVVASARRDPRTPRRVRRPSGTGPRDGRGCGASGVRQAPSGRVADHV